MLGAASVTAAPAKRDATSRDRAAATRIPLRQFTVNRSTSIKALSGRSGAATLEAVLHCVGGALMAPAARVRTNQRAVLVCQLFVSSRRVCGGLTADRC